MALYRWIVTVGAFTMCSRVLGFLRDILIAAAIGAGPVADAFFVAFKLPNFLRRLFAEGAFNAAFVPMFAGLMEDEGKAAAKAFAEDVLGVLLATLLVLVAIAEIAMPWLLYALAPGFADTPEKYDLTVALTRLTFPYILFISLVSLLGGLLTSLYRFAAFAASPILLNLCLIGAILGLARFTETPGHALAWGVSIGGMAQLVWLIVACKRAQFNLRLRVPRLTPGVRRMLKLILPAALGAGVAQVNLVIDVIIATFLPGGSVSYLYYADRVNQLPLGVVGVAVGTALLPLLSRQLRAGEVEAARDSQNRAVEIALLLTLPSAAALMVISQPVIAVLFERGAFGPAESQARAHALIAFALGLPAFVLVKVLTPGFFARQDTRTPVRIAVVCLATNVALNLILMWPLAHVGIALATSISAWLNVALLLRGLNKRDYYRVDPRLMRRLPRMLGACLVMAAALWACERALAGPLEGGLGLRVGALAALVVTGLVIYAVAARLGGAARFQELRRVLRADRG